jgi:ribosomal protein S26
VNIILGISCSRCPNALAVDVSIETFNSDTVIAALEDVLAQAQKDGWTVHTDHDSADKKFHCTTCARALRHIRIRTHHLEDGA